jgi:hypothetical protein
MRKKTTNVKVAIFVCKTKLSNVTLRAMACDTELNIFLNKSHLHF